MSISEIVRQGFHYAVSCRWLWLFGFFVGVASGGSGGGSGHGGDSGGADLGAAAAGSVFLGLRNELFAPIAVAIAVMAIACLVLRFVGEGALIEGVVKARQGGVMSTGEGFRAGWAHWGVLFRIAVIYFLAIAGSLMLLAAPCVLAMWTIGPIGAVIVAIPSVVVAVPWLATLYLLQAFAARIAVLENRHALDAIAKARLFLHGRLIHSLKLMVATLIGSILIAVLAMVTIGPVVLLLVVLAQIMRVMPLIIVGCLVVLPLAYVLTAMLGTFRSSVWTIGYVTQVES
jgi:hypothetical protein